MPAEQRGQPFAVEGGYGLRYYDLERRRRRFTPAPPFPTKTAARAHYRNVIAPKLQALTVAPRDRTLGEFIDDYLKAHKVGREPTTIRTLHDRLRYARDTFGDTKLSDLERRIQEIADWQGTLPERSRYAIVKAFRQALDAAIPWGLMTKNPAKLAGANPKPKRPEIVPFTLEQVDRLSAELADDDGPGYGPLVVFAAETGLRPSEWIALERRDVLKREGVVLIQRTYAGGRLREYGKMRSRRRVPLTARAMLALEQVLPRIDTPLLFPGSNGYLNLHDWRRDDWYPALEAAGLPKCGPYRLRHTFAANALAAGLGIYELARNMGTSVR
jgi:integrase